MIANKYWQKTHLLVHPATSPPTSPSHTPIQESSSSPRHSAGDSARDGGHPHSSQRGHGHAAAQGVVPADDAAGVLLAHGRRAGDGARKGTRDGANLPGGCCRRGRREAAVRVAAAADTAGVLRRARGRGSGRPAQIRWDPRMAATRCAESGDGDARIRHQQCEGGRIRRGRARSGAAAEGDDLDGHDAGASEAGNELGLVEDDDEAIAGTLDHLLVEERAEAQN